MSHFTPGLIWFGSGIILLVVGLWFCTEGVLFWLGKKLITYYVRDWVRGYEYLAFAVGLALVVGATMALTHFVLDASRQ